jgi:hypothetical protein
MVSFNHPSKLYQRNSARRTPVAAAVINRLMDRWEVPDLTEAHHVDYLITS